MRAITLGIALALCIAPLAAKAHFRPAGMRAPTYKQHDRMKAAIAKKLNAQGLHKRLGRAPFTAADVLFNSYASQMWLPKPETGRKYQDSKIPFSVVLQQDKPVYRTHVGPIPFPHHLIPAKGIEGVLTVTASPAKSPETLRLTVRKVQASPKIIDFAIKPY